MLSLPIAPRALTGVGLIILALSAQTLVACAPSQPRSESAPADAAPRPVGSPGGAAVQDPKAKGDEGRDREEAGEREREEGGNDRG